jgi:5-methylcytosine-specific restriction endonuclease McrA
MTKLEEIRVIRKRLRGELAEYLERPHRTQKYRDEARKLIREFFRATLKSKDGWKLLEALDKKDGDLVSASELKGALRDALVKLQSNRCCYCRRWLVNTAYARPIEHVLPRAYYKQFSLHFWNLAVACTDCNSEKSDDVWGSVDRKRRTYPRIGSIGDWYHPRFHEYDEHVRFVRLESNGTTVVVFRGITPQGRALCSSLLRHIAAKEMLIANNASLSSCLRSLNEYGDQFDEGKSKKLRDFQNALSDSVTRMISP